ncbi:hypothetical protein [Pseudomonas rossensis]|uniref:hypothetical protein n=1 Tax=Pseudomonas rossensis TaxID=2305471 RepID=UPI003261AE4C
MKEYEKIGKIVIILSVAASAISFLLSTGYYPQAGFLYSLQNSMHLIDLSIVDGAIRGDECKVYEEDCLRIIILTKYVMVFLLALLTYGVLIYKGLVKNPLSYISQVRRPE